MTGNEFQELALRTRNPDVGPYDLEVNAALGLAGEAGEFADEIKKLHFQGHELNADIREKIKLELGDIAFYIALACYAFGLELDDVLEANITKLTARYPNGFTVERSLNRSYQGKDRPKAEVSNAE